MTSLSRRSILLATAAAVPAFFLPLTVSPADARTSSIELVRLYELATPIGGYFYTTSETELDAAIHDHGFGSTGAQAARFVSRTEFAGSTALHRLRAVDRASYILALPQEAAALRDGGAFTDEGVLGHVDADGKVDQNPLPTGERLATVWRISQAGAWRAVNARLMNLYTTDVTPRWNLDGVLTYAWAVDGA